MAIPKIPAEVLQDFNDSGTGESFKEGDTVSLEPGALTNYEAGGLVKAAKSTGTNTTTN